jgi:hypothetical protein
MSDTAGTTKPMQLAGGDPGEAMVMYLVGMAAVVREEFGGSLDGGERHAAGGLVGMDAPADRAF